MSSCPLMAAYTPPLSFKYPLFFATPFSLPSPLFLGLSLVSLIPILNFHSSLASSLWNLRLLRHIFHLISNIVLIKMSSFNNVLDLVVYGSRRHAKVVFSYSHAFAFVNLRQNYWNIHWVRPLIIFYDAYLRKINEGMMPIVWKVKWINDKMGLILNQSLSKNSIILCFSLCLRNWEKVRFVHSSMASRPTSFDLLYEEPMVKTLALYLHVGIPGLVSSVWGLFCEKSSPNLSVLQETLAPWSIGKIGLSMQLRSKVSMCPLCCI